MERSTLFSVLAIYIYQRLEIYESLDHAPLGSQMKHVLSRFGLSGIVSTMIAQHVKGFEIAFIGSEMQGSQAILILRVQELLKPVTRIGELLRAVYFHVI